MSEFATIFFSFHPLDETWQRRVLQELKTLTDITPAPLPADSDLADPTQLQSREKLFEHATDGVVLLSPAWTASSFVQEFEFPTLKEHQEWGGLRLQVLAIGSPLLSNSMDRWLASKSVTRLDGLTDSELQSRLADLRSRLAECVPELAPFDGESPTVSDGFERLYREHYPVVLRFFRGKNLNEEVSHELAQDTFVKVWGRFQQLREPTKRTRWLHVIASNVWKNWARDQWGTQKRSGCETSLERLQDEVDFEPQQNFTSSAPQTTSESALIQRQQQQRLYTFIDRLKEQDATMLRLHLAGRSMADIADQWGFSPNVAKVRIFRIKRTLASLIRGDDAQ